MRNREEKEEAEDCAFIASSSSSSSSFEIRISVRSSPKVANLTVEGESRTTRLHSFFSLVLSSIFGQSQEEEAIDQAMETRHQDVVPQIQKGISFFIHFIFFSFCLFLFWLDL